MQKKLRNDVRKKLMNHKKKLMKEMKNVYKKLMNKTKKTLTKLCKGLKPKPGEEPAALSVAAPAFKTAAFKTAGVHKDIVPVAGWAHGAPVKRRKLE